MLLQHLLSPTQLQLTPELLWFYRRLGSLPYKQFKLMCPKFLVPQEPVHSIHYYPAGAGAQGAGAAPAGVCLNTPWDRGILQLRELQVRN